MVKEKFEIKKILYPVLTAIILGSASFTADAVMTTYKLKKDISELKIDLDELEKNSVCKKDFNELKESTVNTDQFNSIEQQIISINKSLEVIEQRTYDIWKIRSEK